MLTHVSPVISALSGTQSLTAAKSFIESRISVARDTVGVVLGSGLGGFADEISVDAALDAADIPEYPTSTVAGHHGQLLFGTLGEKPVVLVKGRVHFYEGRSADEVTFYVRLLSMLGVGTLILTNAAGGVNPLFNAGDLCLITDHLNLMFEQSLFAAALAQPTRHKPVYDASLQTLALQTADDCRLKLQSGVYAGVKGPSYETRAEVRMLRSMGADLVGMSTVPESLVASSLGMRVLGISLVTNKATGLSSSVLSHAEVQDVGRTAQSSFSRLLKKFIGESLVSRRQRLTA